MGFRVWGLGFGLESPVPYGPPASRHTLLGQGRLAVEASPYGARNLWLQAQKFWGLGFRVAFRVQGLGLGFRVSEQLCHLGIGVKGLGLRALGLGFRV